MYFVTGATGSLGKELIRVIKNEKKSVRVVEILRTKSDQVFDQSQICMDLREFDARALTLTLENIQPKEKIVLILLAAVSDQDSNAREVFQINYFSAIQICEVFDMYCERNKVPLQIIFALSGTALNPDFKKPNYSASKAALYNYVKFRLKTRNSFSLTCGIFLGPFRSKLWDVDRMKKYFFIALFDKHFTTTSKAHLILRKIDCNKSGIFYHPTMILNILLSLSQIFIRRKLKLN